MTRDEVLTEFGSAWRTTATDAMADRIVELTARLAVVEAERDRYKEQRDEMDRVWREDTENASTTSTRADRAERILALLREPTDHIIVSAYDELCLQDHDNARYSLADTIRAAVAAAEQEVANDAG